MSKAKPFHREKAKSLLENLVVDAVQSYFEQESEKANLKNKSKIKISKENPKFEGFLRMFESIRVKLLSLNQEIENHNKFSTPKKQVFKKAISQFHEVINEFLSLKLFPVKLNNSLVNEINKSDQEISNILNELNKLKGSLFCGSNSRKGIESHFSDLKSMCYFWNGLLKCEAQEEQGIEEIHYGPVFNEGEFRFAIKNLIDKNFPHEQTQIIKEEKIQYQYIDKPVLVVDNVRLAHELLFGLGRPQEISQAITYYYEEAEKNHNVFACNALGQIYFEGIFVPKDINKCYSFYSKSANQHDPEALYRLGMLHEQGYLADIIPDEKESSIQEKHIKIAKSYYEKSAESGHLDALTDLGFIYQMGIKDQNNPNIYIEEPNLKTAIFYYKKAKKKRFPRALNNLGKLYIEYPLEEKVFGDNLRKGIKYLEIASELGNIKALFNLGVCYENGKGISKNHEKARSLFKEASHKGDVNAKLYYANYLLRNANYEDRDEDFVEASFILQEIIAKDPNMAEAYFYLGYLYENGFGVDKNLSFSIDYYNKAAQLEHPPSLNKLGDFFHSGIGVHQKDLSKAFEFYEAAANLNNTNALINLGTLLETGCKDFQKDIEKAIYYYDCAARLGDSRGFLNLAHIQETINKDQLEALKNYEKAAELGNEIAINILGLKGKTYIPSMKKNTLNYPSSNISKIFNNSQLALEDNTQNSFFCKSKEISNKNKNLPTPLISSYISSGIPKQLIHKQMQYDSQLNFESSEKSKLIKTNDDKKGFLSKNSERKQEKKVTLKENIPISNIMYNESESRKMLN